MTAAEVPPEVTRPRQQGEASAASLASFLRLARDDDGALLRERPTTARGLAAQSDLVVRGTIRSAEVERRTVALGGLQAASIDLVLTLDRPSALKQVTDGAVTTWHLNLWMGDPVLAPGMEQKLAAELGPGPVGADSVLFGSYVDGLDGRRVLGAMDGVVDDGTTAARVGRSASPAPAEFASVRATAAALGG